MAPPNVQPKRRSAIQAEKRTAEVASLGIEASTGRQISTAIAVSSPS